MQSFDGCTSLMATMASSICGNWHSASEISRPDSAAASRVESSRQTGLSCGGVSSRDMSLDASYKKRFPASVIPKHHLTSFAQVGHLRRLERVRGRCRWIRRRRGRAAQRRGSAHRRRPRAHGGRVRDRRRVAQNRPRHRDDRVRLSRSDAVAARGRRVFRHVDGLRRSRRPRERRPGRPARGLLRRRQSARVAGEGGRRVPVLRADPSGNRFRAPKFSLPPQVVTHTTQKRRLIQKVLKWAHRVATSAGGQSISGR